MHKTVVLREWFGQHQLGVLEGEGKDVPAPI